MIVVELHRGSYIRVYDSENPPVARKPGEASTFHLTCFGHFDKATNTIWTQMVGSKIPIPLGFEPEVKDFREEQGEGQ